jgi:hypothetical protein
MGCSESQHKPNCTSVAKYSEVHEHGEAARSERSLATLARRVALSGRYSAAIEVPRNPSTTLLAGWSGLR